MNLPMNNGWKCLWWGHSVQPYRPFEAQGYGTIEKCWTDGVWHKVRIMRVVSKPDGQRSNGLSSTFFPPPQPFPHPQSPAHLLTPSPTVPVLSIAQAAKRMAPGSAIVNMSSGSASLGTPLLYSMSKGALNSMQGALVKPLAAKGIRMNAVSPGLTDTDMITEMVQGVDLAATVPMGRVGLPHEIADVVGFLLSPEAAYVHGANVRVAGGRGPGTFLG